MIAACADDEGLRCQIWPANAQPCPKTCHGHAITKLQFFYWRGVLLESAAADACVLQASRAGATERGRTFSGEVIHIYAMLFIARMFPGVGAARGV